MASGMILPGSERDLGAIAVALVDTGTTLTVAERAIASAPLSMSRDRLDLVRCAIARGEDPLGDVFCRLRSPNDRRKTGAVYTPRAIVDAMIDWASGKGTPERIIDPGAGSGRFLLAAGKAFPNAELFGIEIEPLAALILRANASVLQMADRLTLLVDDYRAIDLPEVEGASLYIGNPPYVRHHAISPRWKDWFAEAALAQGYKASKLAGLHIHFILKTRLLARPGDFGAFITSAEWLDVNYGAVMRRLLVNGLGGTALHVIAPTAMPFGDTAATGAIICFDVGHRHEAMRFRSVENASDLGSLASGQPVPWSRLDGTRRWSPLLRSSTPLPKNYVELGELCRVHRGQVTGCNAVWIAGAQAGALPKSALIPTVTKARELFGAVPNLSRCEQLRRVIDLPISLDEFDEEERRKIDKFLAWARSLGADKSYIARHRRAWWAVGLRAPAPVLCTYMARRPPAFVRNVCGARHLNIAHGIYPRDPLPDKTLDTLSAWLRGRVTITAGRTYAGGLTKFEPKELERVMIPPLEELHERAQELDFGGTDARFGDRQRPVPPHRDRPPKTLTQNMEDFIKASRNGTRYP